MHEDISGPFRMTDDGITSETGGSTAGSEPVRRTADRRRAVVEPMEDMSGRADVAVTRLLHRKPMATLISSG